MADNGDSVYEVEEDDGDMRANGNNLGLIDYAHGRSDVQDWTRQKPIQRGASKHGLSMYIPHAKYICDRCSFDAG
ncbi:Uncharacterized protein TPAR_04373 [Tolypocladium paradoxum]|uniref:Uncharacterized protein n=1 Tax=Tolypocladium paradoxum TaxID=94208 RepID=A0A2S4KZ21_9HYPO|nr:Uncharacterized protein TPAR_04373 [Tolypocladium paradoxum]